MSKCPSDSEIGLAALPGTLLDASSIHAELLKGLNTYISELVIGLIEMSSLFPLLSRGTGMVVVLSGCP